MLNVPLDSCCVYRQQQSPGSLCQWALGPLLVHVRTEAAAQPLMQGVLDPGQPFFSLTSTHFQAVAQPRFPLLALGRLLVHLQTKAAANKAGKKVQVFRSKEQQLHHPARLGASLALPRSRCPYPWR